jgi:7,8-dihydroneopterin aldolase/epimerase/oxygenase
MRVFIEGLDLYAYHGVPDEERAIGHRYTIDVQMDVTEQASTTDRVQDTVDYGQIAKEVQQLAESAQFRTLERLAAEIARKVMEGHPTVTWISVSVRKPKPPAPVIAESVGVTHTLSR